MPRFIPPTFQQMRLFEAVARHGSITHAAHEVNLTQPSVSMQVKSMEEKIGLPLTEQVGRSLKLTHAGEAVAAASRDILARIDDLKIGLEDMKREVAGPVSITAVSTTKYFLPQLVGDFKRRHPRVTPRLTITNRSRVLESMRAGDADLYIMGQPPDGAALIYEPFLENVIVFVARADHPLVGKKSIPLNRLAEENLIGREAGSGTRKAVESLWDEAGTALVPHMEFDDTEAIKQGIISGLGVAYLSMQALRLELAAGELAVLDVQGFPMRRPWFAVHRQGRRLTNAAQSFLDYMKEEAGTSA